MNIIFCTVVYGAFIGFVVVPIVKAFALEAEAAIAKEQ